MLKAAPSRLTIAREKTHNFTIVAGIYNPPFVQADKEIAVRQCREAVRYDEGGPPFLAEGL